VHDEKQDGMLGVSWKGWRFVQTWQGVQHHLLMWCVSSRTAKHILLKADTSPAGICRDAAVFISSSSIASH
jgi:hypothetical protein